MTVPFEPRSQLCLYTYQVLMKPSSNKNCHLQLHVDETLDKRSRRFWWHWPYCNFTGIAIKTVGSLWPLLQHFTRSCFATTVKKDVKLNPQLHIGDHDLTEAVFMTFIIDIGDNVTGIANIYSTQLLQLRNIKCVIKDFRVFNMELLNYTYLFSIPPCPYHSYVG